MILLDLTFYLQENVDRGFYSRIIQIDFSVEFDLINHKALLFTKSRNRQIYFRIASRCPY